MIDHLVTGADALHAGYAQYYRISRERIVTLPNWIDVESEQLKFASVDKAAVRNRLNIPEGSQVLLFVHRLAMRKGAHLLPEIFAGLQDRMMHRVFVIVGDGPERESIEQILRERGLWYNVRMLGSIPQESVHELYAIADLLLLPSEEEGFPHVLTEAQSIGLPYVASDVGGVREMTPPECSQSIVSYGDIASFNKAARVLLENAEYHCRFNKSVQVWVTRYDKTLILQRFIKLVTSKS